MLAAYDFWITFAPGVIEFDKNIGDHDWPEPEFGQPFTFNVDNVAGSASFNEFFTGITAPSVDIKLVVLEGTATATVSTKTPLCFNKADIKHFCGDPISADSTDGEVVVLGPTPTPTSTPTSKPTKTPTPVTWDFPHGLIQDLSAVFT